MYQIHFLLNSMNQNSRLNATLQFEGRLRYILQFEILKKNLLFRVKIDIMKMLLGGLHGGRT